MSNVAALGSCLWFLLALSPVSVDLAAQQSYDPPKQGVVDHYKGRCSQEANGKTIEGPCTINVLGINDGQIVVAWSAGAMDPALRREVDMQKQPPMHINWLGVVKDGTFTAQEKKPNFFTSGGGVFTNQELDLVLTRQMTPRGGTGEAVVQRFKATLETRVNPRAPAKVVR